jgi:hypothetical protein
MKEKSYKDFVIALILEEYEFDGVNESDAEEIYNLFMEFDELTKITEIVDAYEIWLLEKMNESVAFEEDVYEA